MLKIEKQTKKAGGYMKKHKLEDRIATIHFDSGLQFRIDFLPENQLRWTSIREEDAGATAKDRVIFSEIMR